MKVDCLNPASDEIFLANLERESTYLKWMHTFILIKHTVFKFVIKNIPSFIQYIFSC